MQIAEQNQSSVQGAVRKNTTSKTTAAQSGSGGAQIDCAANKLDALISQLFESSIGQPNMLSTEDSCVNPGTMNLYSLSGDPGCAVPVPNSKHSETNARKLLPSSSAFHRPTVYTLLECMRSKAEITEQNNLIINGKGDKVVSVDLLGDSVTTEPIQMAIAEDNNLNNVESDTRENVIQSKSFVMNVGAPPNHQVCNPLTTVCFSIFNSQL